MKNVSAIIFLFLIMWSCQSAVVKDTLLLYCAAGMKPAIQEITDQFFKDTGIQVDVQYAGSGTLLSNLRISKQGDLYLSADESYIHEARKFNLIDTQKAIANIRPVIAVSKGNPKKINHLDDLLRNDVKLVLANPDAASIGRQTKIILAEYSDFGEFRKNVLAFMPTVNEVLNTVKLGSSDAGIVWNANANQYNEITTIEDPFLNKYKHTITIGLLHFSEDRTSAIEFINYLSSPKHGGKVLERLGYETVN